MNKINNETNILLQCFFGCLTGFIVIIFVLYGYDQVVHYETLTTIHTFTGNGVAEFPASAKIICEEGLVVDDLSFLGIGSKKIYGCLALINNTCSGTGKLCLIETKERVHKNE